MRCQDALPFSVIGIDVERFSARRASGQVELRRGLRETFDEACIEAGVTLVEPLRDEGDGGLGLFGAETSMARLAADLPRELAAALSRRNADRTPAGRLRVRLALDHGPVLFDGHGWVGAPLVRTARLLNSEVGRTLLTQVPAANLVMLLSEPMYDDTVAEESRTLVPDLFAKFRLGSHEKGKGIAGWATLWGRSQLAPPPALEDGDVNPTDGEVGPPYEEGRSNGRDGRPSQTAFSRPATSTGARTVGINMGVTTLGDRSDAFAGDVGTVIKGSQ